jgi:cytochrome c peroxidase
MTRIPNRLVLLCLALPVLSIALKVNTRALSASSPQQVQPGVQVRCDQEPCDAVARGFHAFHDRALAGMGGNGRSCADCHMPTDHFQLSPAGVEARFQRLMERRESDPLADDPLFRAVDADDFRTNGQGASDFSNLRQNGLVRVTFRLPPQLRLIDPATGQVSAETHVDVWRMVPTVNDVRLTGDDGLNPWPRGPNATGGYQLDARFRTLQEQALGALESHAEITGTAPQRFLDDVAAFQMTLFSSPGLKALADALDAGTDPLPDPDPPLNELEQEGKADFVRACATCHGGPRQTTATNIIRYHGIFSGCPRPVDPQFPPRWQFDPCPPRLARNARLYRITQIDGSVVVRPSSDPGRALLTGFVGGPPPLDDWTKFDTPGMRGIANTAPYFHNNSADTLEDVVDHYIELFKFARANTPPGAPLPPIISTDGVNFDRQLTPEDRLALIAYLRKQ